MRTFNWFWIGLLMISGLWLIPFGNVSAHGTEISYTVQPSIEIEALFDTGEPMANAQITVYAPTDRQTPWLRGEADENGRFIFSPDPSIPGDWDVSIRSAGHGEIIQIPFSAESSGTFIASGGQTPLQRFVLAAAVVWGFVGTALYFSGRRQRSAAIEETSVS